MSFDKVKNKFLTEDASFVLVIVGLVILGASFILFLCKTSSLSANASIDSGIFDHFGSLIGGLVGSIWALAGFILFYVALTEQKISTEASIDALKLQKEELQLQRAELKMQRDELKDTRKEFEIERITTLIYKQLERIDSIISFIPFDYPTGHPISGIFGLRHLNTHFRGSFVASTGNIPDVIQTIHNYKEKMINLFSIIETSKIIIEQQLCLTGLDDTDKKRLDSIFAQNIDPEIYKSASKVDYFINSFLESDLPMPNKQKFIDNLTEIHSSAKNINHLFESRYV